MERSKGVRIDQLHRRTVAEGSPWVAWAVVAAFAVGNLQAVVGSLAALAVEGNLQAVVGSLAVPVVVGMVVVAFVGDIGCRTCCCLFSV